MIIGIDFDNTIAAYDHVFAPAAVELGLLPPGGAGSKRAVRDAIRASTAGEEGWMRLQGQVYGRLMERARPFDGLFDFLDRARARGAAVWIVSHKTEHGHFDPHRVNLREAALRWMEATGLFDTATTGLAANRVFFEATREEKIRRIGALGCDVFVDDLPEVFLNPAFPPEPRRFLFLPGEDGAAQDVPVEGATPYRHWREIADDLFGPR